MDLIFPMSKWLIAIPIILLVFCGGLFFGQRGNHHKMLSEKQTVWLLIGLLVIAAISMGIFFITILGWQGGICFS